MIDRDTNPWGVTDIEAEVMDAMCELGSPKAVAAALLIAHGTVLSRLRCACIRMAGHKPAARHITRVDVTPTIVACIKWAEWTRRHE